MPIGNDQGRFTFSGFSDISSGQYGGNPVNVETNVVVTVVFSSAGGELNREVPITITTGTNSATGSFDSVEGDYIESTNLATILSISPSSFGSQIYSNGGIQNIGSCP